MYQDPTNQYISAIMSHCDVSGKELLEIGCGKGRITRELVRHARRVVATDPDPETLERARDAIVADNVEFILVPTGVPDLPVGTFDVVIYSLSLHHVPVGEMTGNLCRASALLKESGVMVVVEPGDGGSLTEAKERFGAGSGDERTAREAALRAMHALEGWTVGETITFRTLFRFDDAEDFLTSMLPDYRLQPESFVAEVRAFLDLHRTSDGIILEADRRLNVLRPAQTGKPSYLPA